MADLSADRLIREYLARVAEAGTRYLPMGRRGAFVQSTRRRIERQIGPGGARDAEHVRDVLARLGEPEDLVKAERARMDAERIKRQPGNLGLGGTDETSATAPFEVRSIRSRWKPGKERAPRREPSADQADAGSQNRPAVWRGAPGEGKRKGWLGGLLLDRPGRHEAQPGEQEPQQGGPRPPETTAGQAGGGAAGRAPSGTASQAPSGTASQAPSGTASQAPSGTASQPPGDTVGQAPRGAVGRAPRGAVGRAPSNTAGPTADGTAGQAPGGKVGQAPGGTAGQAPGGTAGQAPGNTAGQRPQGGQEPGWVPWAWRNAGAQSSDHTVPLTPGQGRTPAPGGPGAQAPGGISARALGGAESAPAPQQPANWARPAAAGAGRAGDAARSEDDTPPGGIPIPPHEVYTVRGAAAAVGRGTARLAVEAARLAREYPLESASVTLLAIGGLILPFPYWLFGGLLGGILAIRSRI